MLSIFAFLASPLGKLCGYGLVALIALATIFGVKAEWDRGRAAVHEVHQIAAVAKVQTKAVAAADKATAAADTRAQVKIVTRTRTLLKEIPTYVTVATPCIPWSVVRLHDAAVLGVDPSTLSPPADQSPDACSDVSPSAFVATVVSNYGAADANARQLDDLIADAEAREKAVVPVAGVVASP